MKNIEKFNVEELSSNELELISGGGLFKKLGRAVGDAWCKVKEFASNMDNHAALGHVTGSHG